MSAELRPVIGEHRVVALPGPRSASRELPGTPFDEPAFAEFCETAFEPLTRSDQRTWAQVYLRGLLTTPGRKTPARISRHVLGRSAVAQLQQFVNQSPWDHAAVRGRLAGLVEETLPVQAWAVDVAAFEKTGDCSVGVARQYSVADERMLNCQLAVTVALTTEQGSLPVNWRLLLPASWDADADRRDCAHLPVDVRHEPLWESVLAVVDKLAVDWNLSPAPVVLDWRQHSDDDLEHLASGLDERGHEYLIAIHGSTGLPGGDPARAARRHSARDVVRTAFLRARRMTVTWMDARTGRLRRSQFVAGGLPAGTAVRQILAEWPAGREEPRAFWLTNIGPRRMAQLAALAGAPARAREAIAEMGDRLGLRDFEGRSFRGWHHHVTLASAAYAVSTLCVPEANSDAA
jgi:hypothetical protein